MNQFSHAGWGPVPEALLANHPKISVSGLMEFHESPANYEAVYLLGEREETRPMLMGKAKHAFLLEPEKFEMEFCGEQDMPKGVIDTADQLRELATKHGIAKSGSKAEITKRLREAGLEFTTYEEWEAGYAKGREILKRKEFISCQRVKARIQANKRLNYFITGGEPEKLGWALHRRSGVIITFKMDYFKKLDREVLGCNVAVLDFKNVQSVKKRLFSAGIWQNALHIQAALYVDIAQAMTEQRALFLWLAAEEKPPYHVAGLSADFGMLEAGHNEYNKDLISFIECYEKKKWPTYYDDIQNISLPEYAWSQLDAKSHDELEQMNQQGGQNP